MPLSLNDHFRAMARNGAWADARLLGACAGLGEAELDAPRTGFFPSLRLTLVHVLEVDRHYLADLDGRGRAVWRDTPPPATFTALAAAQAEHDRRLVAFCDALDDAGLDRVVAIDRDDGIPFSPAKPTSWWPWLQNMETSNWTPEFAASLVIEAPDGCTDQHQEVQELARQLVRLAEEVDDALSPSLSVP